jgi:hypothetical protein
LRSARTPRSSSRTEAILTAMAYIAIQEQRSSITVDWMEKVNDKQYRR